MHTKEYGSSSDGTVLISGKRSWVGIGLGRVAAIVPLVCLVMAVHASPVLADTPHVRPTSDTASCAACHSSHVTENAELLRTSSGPEVSVTEACIACHLGADASATNVATGTADSFGLPSGHVLGSGPTGSASIAGCDTCHEVHGASEIKRGIPAKIINGVAVSSAGKELCLACHDSANSWYGPGYPASSAPTRDATGFPVLGTWPGPTVYASATNAHRLIPETTQTVGVTDPVRREKGDCVYCHAAHGGVNEYDGLVATFTVPVSATLASDTTDGSYGALCFTCHGDTKPSGFATASVDIKQFATASGGRGGHTIATAGGTLPVGAPLPCFECHNPHGSARGNSSMLSDELGASLETSTTDGTRAFCFTCHSTCDAVSGWNSETATYTPVGATATVVGLPRNSAELRLSPRDGHAQDSTQSCYQCHGSSYAPGGTNVHDPSDGKVVSARPAFSFIITPGVVTTVSATATMSAEPSATIEADSTVAAADITPPITVSDIQPAYTGTATITLTAVDDTGGVGVSATYYSLDGAEAATGTVVSVSAVGPHQLSFWSVDRAGNIEPTIIESFTMEAPPLAPQQVTLGVRRGIWVAGGT